MMMDLAALIGKYERSGPRYTSYPTALHFTEAFGATRLNALAVDDAADCSLYAHIPFCASLCWFCACSSSVCTDPSLIDNYLSLMEKELELWRAAGLEGRVLRQIHFGGGTPNILGPEQILRLNRAIEKHFQKSADCEFSVEIDPRTFTRQKAEAFAQIGVNRASIGVQDTNAQTQKAIHRIQPQQMNLDAVKWLRESGINKINADLIYGLPLQTLETFSQTLEDFDALGADRCALFSYAHVPWVKPSQKNVERHPLPAAAEKIKMFSAAMEHFENPGFEYIGLDHFAKPQDELVKARLNGTLHRNFQGYSTHAGLNCVGIGLTSISQTSISYRQNFKSMKAYEESVLAGKIPTERGVILTSEDMLRRKIIMDVMCKLKINFADYCADFETKFAGALAQLGKMREDGIVVMREGSFEITKLGRIFLRDVAMLFDAYLKGGETGKYSKTL